MYDIKGCNDEITKLDGVKDLERLAELYVKLRNEKVGSVSEDRDRLNSMLTATKDAYIRVSEYIGKLLVKA